MRALNKNFHIAKTDKSTPIFLCGGRDNTYQYFLSRGILTVPGGEFMNLDNSFSPDKTWSGQGIRGTQERSPYRDARALEAVGEVPVPDSDSGYIHFTIPAGVIKWTRST